MMQRSDAGPASGCDGTQAHAHQGDERTKGGVVGLIIGSIGVVYGDIGTSPLYTLKEVFGPSTGVPLDAPGVDPLKYQRESQQTRAAGSGELLTVKVRFKEPDGETSRLRSRVLTNQSTAMTANLGFASAVAEFGMLLRE
ncbi:YfbK domain-containing protein, partial [Methylocystis sp.]|uniref:YfbK domain-containing protein n=1 Tax=Methylocystis sp. TaxID=1911079 RepID=UPI003DA51D8C